MTIIISLPLEYREHQFHFFIILKNKKHRNVYIELFTFNQFTFTLIGTTAIYPNKRLWSGNWHFTQCPRYWGWKQFWYSSFLTFLYLKIMIIIITHPGL